jgi:hypothetical protein
LGGGGFGWWRIFAKNGPQKGLLKVILLCNKSLVSWVLQKKQSFGDNFVTFDTIFSNFFCQTMPLSYTVCTVLSTKVMIINITYFLEMILNDATSKIIN